MPLTGPPPKWLTDHRACGQLRADRDVVLLSQVKELDQKGNDSQVKPMTLNATPSCERPIADGNIKFASLHDAVQHLSLILFLQNVDFPFWYSIFKFYSAGRNCVNLM